VKCVACGQIGTLHKTQGGQEFGPACQKHAGLAWSLMIGGSKYEIEVERWLMRRELAEASGLKFAETMPKSPAEKELEMWRA